MSNVRITTPEEQHQRVQDALVSAKIPFRVEGDTYVVLTDEESEGSVKKMREAVTD